MHGCCGCPVRARIGFPTVGELFQGSFSGLSLVNNNPYLKPENDLSRELSAECDHCARV